MAMMRRRILGIAIEENGLTLAELQAEKKGFRVHGAGAFPFSDGLSLDKPVALGKALQQHLREAGFSAGSVVLGAPASWVLVRERQFPASSGAVLQSMVRLEAEQAFPGQELVVDYADGGIGTEQRTALLAAMNRERLNAITDAMKSAGLTVCGVLPTAIALARAGKAGQGRNMTLRVNENRAEATLANNGVPTLVRHLPLSHGEGALADLVGSVRRIISLLPAEEAALPIDKCIVWGNPPWSTDALGEAMGLAVALPGSLDMFGLVDGALPAPEVDTQSCAAAMALALCGLQPGALPIDFLHSRLAPARKRLMGRKAAWAAGALIALLAAGGLLFDDWRKAHEELTALRAQVLEMTPDIEAARSVVDRAVFARGWYSRRPYFLDCIREVALNLPEEGRIWVTSMGVRQDMKTVVSGQSVDERTVLDVLDRLKRSENLSDVRLVHLREGGGRNRELSFAIQFAFVGKALRQ